MSKFNKILISLSISLVLLLVVALLLLDQKVFVYRQHEIQMETSLLNPEILKGIQKKMEVRLLPYKNKNIWTVSLSQLQKNLLQDPWLESVQIRRHLPSGLTLNVQLKQVVLLAHHEGGKALTIALDGSVIAKIPIEQAPDVPWLSSKAVLKDKAKMDHLIEAYLQMPEEGLLSRAVVAEVDWSDEEGLRVEMIDSESGSIRLGKKDIHKKCRRVANVLKYLESQKQRWRVIDASFSKKVLVRLRKHS